MASESSESTPTPERTDSAAPASYRTIHTTPPPVRTPYTPADALLDLPGVSYALDQFLASRMHESEAYMNASDPSKERLYFATGYGLIQCVKGLMSYADEDLLAAIGHTKQGVLIASQHRKKQPYLASRLAGYVVSSLNTTGTNFIRTMTDVERHAELVYAESLFEKALLGIVYSGDWLAFIKEALNMRTTITIYRTLFKYVQAVDAEYAASLSSPSTNGSTGGRIESPAIDPHFRSGVYLGAGMSTLILSLLPARILNIIELFGYAADRDEALEVLGRAGGWGAPPHSNSTSTEEEQGPSIDTSHEGVRRAICDMALLIFHLVLSSYTFHGVDTKMAARIVGWNLKRYPEGVFFLFGAGRLALMRSQPREAIHYYTLAMAAQKQYRNLHHISYWEMAIAHLALTDVKESLGCWRVLEGEATWSKSIYSYGVAVCLLDSTSSSSSAAANGENEGGGEGEGGKEGKEGGEETETEKEKKARLEEARKMMERVPGLRQKIAGKSIPLEKFVARRARKFASQSNRLLLPALELAYVFLAIAHAPRGVVRGRMLPSVRGALSELGVDAVSVSANGSGKENGEGKEKEKEGEKGKKEWEARQGYWDDYCLARFLEGVCLRYVAFPDPDAVLPPDEPAPSSADIERIGKDAKEAFERVFEAGPRIELDHHLVYHAHYEYGRLLACMDDADGARRHFEMVLSGKPLEVGPSGRKVGKYSMENALHMRTQAALEALTLAAAAGAKKRRL
ncbi:hypothetical protein C8R45DRAFT_1030124 [Mycena sanguinolenta]|nr:hypothetical protein C8R45DRAFT_1030124 [Mycena sanguinolenta]